MTRTIAFVLLRSRTLLSAAFLAIAAASSTQLLHAQTTASISGTVLDSTGAVVPNAKVMLTKTDTNEVRTLQSNGAGYFTFAGIVPGSYKVDVTAKGFRTLEQPGIDVNPGDTRALTGLNLATGGANEEVTISTSAQALAPQDSAERSSLITSRDIARLPLVSRNASELLKVLPGVTSTANGAGNGTGFDFTDNGSSGSAVGVGLNTNGAPYRGGTAYLLDGADIIDPGCACWSIATVNPDMTQEVKVQSSNFGADAPQGPVVINVISRSGGAQYHGQAYLYARNGVLNANTYADKQNKTPRPDASYYYPGFSIGGPIQIPHTSFGKRHQLLFWAGFEDFRQTLPTASPLTSFVPTAAMRAGNFSLTDPDNAALCAHSTGSNDFCKPLTGGFAPNGAALTGTQIPAQYIDSNALALLKLFPAANTNPSSNASGYNYFLQPTNVHNGYIYRGRVDYNPNDTNKLFVSYQAGSDSETTPAHIYYNPADAVAYPGGPLISPTNSHVLSGSYIHIFNAATTNEVRVSRGWLNNPFSASNLNAMQKATVGYTGSTIYNTASTLVPSINADGDRTLPDISQADLFQQGGTYNTVKSSLNISDDFTAVYRTHTFKVGGYWNRSANKQGTYGYPNGSLSYGGTPLPDQITGVAIGTNNPLANFLMGIAAGYTQANVNPIDDMFYNDGAGYFLDNWKVKPRLTLNLGIRVEHVGRWQDGTGTGLAVWEPAKYAADVAAGKAYPGVYWRKLDGSLPNGGSPVQTLLFEPRLGLAYDVRGNGKTVVRGGWASYRWADQYNDYAGPLTTSQGVRTFNSNSGNAITLSQISALGANAAALGSLPSSVAATDQNDDKVGNTYAYNLTLSQQLPGNMLLEAAYVGNNTTNLLMGGQSNSSGVGGAQFINQNKIPLGGLFKADPVTGAPAPANPENVPSIVDYYPFYKGYGTNAITVATHAGYSNYNGLQFSLIKQTGRITFDANYTYSRSLGIVAATLDAFSVHGNYGVENIDRPHVVNTSYAFDLGKPIHSNAVLGELINGWTLSGITTWQAGGNMQANVSENLGLTINNTTTGRQVTSNSYYGTPVQTVMPIATCNPNAGLLPYQHINLACISAPQIGQVGPRQLPYLSLASYFDSDLGIYKTFHIHGAQNVELRGQALNFLNHPLPGYSGSGLVQPVFNTTDNKAFTPAVSPVGRGITDTKFTQRTVLLAVKYLF
jgi:hypothetical protein